MSQVNNIELYQGFEPNQPHRVIFVLGGNDRKRNAKSKTKQNKTNKQTKTKTKTASIR